MSADIVKSLFTAATAAAGIVSAGTMAPFVRYPSPSIGNLQLITGSNVWTRSYSRWNCPPRSHQAISQVIAKGNLGEKEMGIKLTTGCRTINEEYESNTKLIMVEVSGRLGGDGRA